MGADTGGTTIRQTLRRLGGVTTWKELRSSHPKRRILRAVRDGELVRASRGHYVLPTASAHVTAAQSCAGVLSHLSAAIHHGWKVKSPPGHAWVTVPRKRHVRKKQRHGIRPHHADLTAKDVEHGVTTPLRTVIDCARVLPFDEALVVADSALRARAVTRGELADAVRHLRGPGAVAARRVVKHADGRAANPFESVLRALCIEEGFELTPQVTIAETGLYAVVDLGSEALRLAVEADGFETHGTRGGLRKDCERHTLFAIYAYSSLRFAYEHVMFEPDWVRWALRTWRAVRAGQPLTDPPLRSHRQAKGS
ncbi:MAG TPA: type IV toxin-antitoxin system AbiEi family antitoxin domain-containing protein [Ornithinibacter sp.]|nr:type IV toxin-antitoxin system AbiEi family antitoxin domain-containing protein [Ornithinibacter sp.]